ncbi:hypothetical protein SAMN05216252_121145 [Actinacidiphila glaucinigra]|uniref:Uncharacterized protein n=1 Tax=Actinacidiphila glaucinigra TaxID=235986 RepID=A0A239LW50_9ACTN|nr:hypothetical protein SAMN05216252_121145 [Actinacidiphila glaucinigra]
MPTSIRDDAVHHDRVPVLIVGRAWKTPRVRRRHPSQALLNWPVRTGCRLPPLSTTPWCGSGLNKAVRSPASPNSRQHPAATSSRGPDPARPAMKAASYGAGRATASSASLRNGGVIGAVGCSPRVEDTKSCAVPPEASVADGRCARGRGTGVSTALIPVAGVVFLAGAPGRAARLCPTLRWRLPPAYTASDSDGRDEEDHQGDAHDERYGSHKVVMRRGNLRPLHLHGTRLPSVRRTTRCRQATHQHRFVAESLQSSWVIRDTQLPVLIEIG